MGNAWTNLFHSLRSQMVQQAQAQAQAQAVAWEVEQM